jgi:hypothetical protein
MLTVALGCADPVLPPVLSALPDLRSFCIGATVALVSSEPIFMLLSWIPKRPGRELSA